MSKITMNLSEAPISLAVLIDDSNISIKYIDIILNEIYKYGNPIIKRVYGNFVGKNAQWKEIINEYALKPMQQFEYSTGKNSTDCFMIIDAMDLLYNCHDIQGFCIVSSDSDFTSLAIRLKEQGMKVYGLGMSKTPKAFRNACTKFISLEELDNALLIKETIKQKQDQIKNKEESLPKIEKLKPLLRNIFSNNNWVQLGFLGQKLREYDPTFTPKSYGFKNLSTLVKEYTQIFEHKIKNKNQIYIKIKK